MVHVYLLVAFEQRVPVSLRWLWRYVTFQRGARLITNNPDRSQAVLGGEPGSDSR